VPTDGPSISTPTSLRRGPSALDALQGLLADEAGFLAEVDHPGVAHVDLERVGVVPHVAAEREDASLDAADVAGPGHLQPVRPAGLEDGVPQPGPVGGRVVQVDLVAELAGVAAPGHAHPHARQLQVPGQVVVRQIQDRLAEQAGHHRAGFRALDLHRRHVHLADRDVQPGVIGEPAGPCVQHCCETS